MFLNSSISLWCNLNFENGVKIQIRGEGKKEMS